MRILPLLFVSALYCGSLAAQNEPIVTTNPKYARGATMAFGRMTSKSNGSAISERGFCWATHPQPTYDENKTKKTMAAGSGTVYVIENLEPATMYYMRAYAIAQNGSVGYGDEIKFCTVPKGNVTYWYNNGGDDAANKRINDAAAKACQIFNDLTSIQKHFSIGYSAGTPTADCYYADEPWMNMGASSSYQRTGTIMHEMQHGMGVIPYTTQWAGNIMRSGNGTGDWLGERVSAFLDFWDNTTGSFLHGDTQHMWPYGINGASEDDGANKTYYANAMIGQALGEDGLEHRSNTFAEPCYIFEQEDDIKYYLKNESEDRGLNTSYLIPKQNGTLNWRTMSGDEALKNDSAAWYITFTPANQYYQLRNAATGQYLTFSGGFKTAERTSLTDNDNFHFMRGRVDVAGSWRGYWLVHPTGNLSPNCLQANTNGAVGSATFNLANSAKNQRWLILTAEEVTTFDNAAMASIKAEAEDIIAQYKAIYEVPHTTDPEEADQTFLSILTDAEQRLASASTAGELVSLSDEVRTAALAFLNAATPMDMSKPFDLTFLIQNPGMDTTDGWSDAATLNYSCAEYYEKTFDFNQIIRNLPKGTFCVRVHGFQRPGTYTQAYNDYAAGTNNVNAILYAGSKIVKLAHIADCAQTKKLGKGTEQQVGGKYYVPDNMQAAANYFAHGLYENELYYTNSGTQMKIGIRSTSMPSRYWVIFDNFRLHFYGSATQEVITAIEEVGASIGNNTDAVYDLSGRRVSSKQLKPGLYIINGKKTFVR